MSVYSPLRRRLANDPEDTVILSFAEIERLLGRKLPRSAYDARIRRQWWANTDTHVQARAWLKAGRRARLDAAGDRVVFVRDAASVEDIWRIDGAALTPAARQLVRETARAWDDDSSAAAATLLNEAAMARRLAILEEMDRIRGRTVYSERSSVDLIREERDAR
jgi:hypothetical protein